MDTKVYVTDAGNIWKDFCNSMKNKQFLELDPDARLDFFQSKYKNFTKEFPIVIRFMVQLGQYSKKAFVRFLKKLSMSPYGSTLDFCKIQSKYVEYLYLEVSNDHDIKKAKQAGLDAYKMLKAEVEQFESIADRVKKNLDQNKIKDNEARRAELVKYLQNYGREN